MGLRMTTDAGTTAVYAGSGIAVFFGFTQAEWGIIGVIIGIACALIGLGFNIWFKMRYHR